MDYIPVSLVLQIFALAIETFMWTWLKPNAKSIGCRYKCLNCKKYLFCQEIEHKVNIIYDTNLTIYINSDSQAALMASDSKIVSSELVEQCMD